MAENLIYPFFLWYNTRPKQRVNMIRSDKTFSFSREAHAMQVACVASNFTEPGKMSVRRAKLLLVWSYGA